MSISYALIIVHSDKLDFKPPCPYLLAGLQPFKIGVDWENNKGRWRKVTVQNFQKADRSGVSVMPPFESWELPDTGYKDFYFEPTSADFYCKYEVVLEDYSGKTFTIDPVVLIKKPGFDQAG
jgi:hypothetical protein